MADVGRKSGTPTYISTSKSKKVGEVEQLGHTMADFPKPSGIYSGQYPYLTIPERICFEIEFGQRTGQETGVLGGPKIVHKVGRFQFLCRIYVGTGTNFLKKQLLGVQ